MEDEGRMEFERQKGVCDGGEFERAVAVAVAVAVC